MGIDSHDTYGKDCPEPFRRARRRSGNAVEGACHELEAFYLADRSAGFKNLIAPVRRLLDLPRRHS